MGKKRKRGYVLESVVSAKMAWHEDKCDRQQIDLQRYLVHACTGLLMCEVR